MSAYVLLYILNNLQLGDKMRDLPTIYIFSQLYLRNLLTHTVNYLLQTLNNVKVFNFLLSNKNSILFTSCVKNSEQYLEYYANYSLFNLKGSKPEVTKIGI